MPTNHDVPAGDPARGESPEQRADRNWDELLQEVRIVQTGVQVLTGFLLTLPFQSRFEDLDAYQRSVYLGLVIVAVTSTALLMTPVRAHRALFRRREKPGLVEAADRLARASLVLVAVLVAGSATFVFDVVVGRTAGLVVAGVLAAGFATLWLLVPRRISRARHGYDDGP